MTMSFKHIDVLPNDCMEIIQFYVVESSCDDMEKEVKESIGFMTEFVKSQFYKMRNNAKAQDNLLEILFELTSLEDF